MENEIDAWIREHEGSDNPALREAARLLKQIRDESEGWQRQAAFNLKYQDATLTERLRVLGEALGGYRNEHDQRLLEESEGALACGCELCEKARAALAASPLETP